MANAPTLSTVSPPQEPREPQKLFFSNVEIETVTGIDRSTWYLLARRREDPAPCLKVGGRVLWPKEQVLKWLFRQRPIQTEPAKRRGRPRKHLANVQ